MYIKTNPGMVTKVLYTFERVWGTRLAPPTPLPTPRLFPPYPNTSTTPSPSPSKLPYIIPVYVTVVTYIKHKYIIMHFNYPTLLLFTRSLIYMCMETRRRPEERGRKTIMLLMVVKLYACAKRLMHAVIFGQPNNRISNVWYYLCSAPFHYTQCVIVANTLSLLTPSPQSHSSPPTLSPTACHYRR